MKTILITISVCLIHGTVSAATRSSANYALLTETTDGGGRKFNSAAYAIDCSLGAVSGTSSMSNAAAAANSGFIGQLVEITSLALSASSTNLSEGTALRLTATAGYDDGTYADVTGTGARWSSVSPLIVSSANGFMRAGSVYKNTPDAVQASYLGYVASIGLLVVNTHNDDFGSYAGDGLDDAWQVQYLGLNNPNARPNSDPDADGQNNGYEFTVGTSPTDPASRFQMSIAKAPGQPTSRNITFSPRLPTRSYQVEYRANLTFGNFTPLTGALTSDAGQERTVTDLNPTNFTSYYRVRITSP